MIKILKDSFYNKNDIITLYYDTIYKNYILIINNKKKIIKNVSKNMKEDQ